MFVRPWQAINHTIYTDPASPSTSMSLDVWGSLEGHLAVLNGHNISVQFFMGFNAQGPNAGDLRWASMSEQTQRWWVSYVVARLAPFANIIGYQFSSETKGNDPKSDYGLATMLQQADPFHHGRTYEEMNATVKNHFDLDEWTFASVEALGDGDARLCGGTHRRNISCVGGSTQNHHDISLQGYRGKPVYMCEGHDLWRSWWLAKEPNVVRAAWAVTTAAASFTWSDLGHARDDPYYSHQAFATYPSAAKAIDVLNTIMTERVPAFHRMVPADALVAGPAPDLTFCLAERGRQYIVYSDAGEPFRLDTRAADTGDSAAAAITSSSSSLKLTWFDPVTGASTAGGLVPMAAAAKLTPPAIKQHWVAMLLLAE